MSNDNLPANFYDTADDPTLDFGPDDLGEEEDDQ